MWALRGCSLQLPTGRVAALVGPNGAGKTTLLHLAVGLVRPDAGAVRVLGATLVATAFALLMSWWLTPLVSNSSLLQFPFFDLYGLAPVGYTVFAVARIAVGVVGGPRFQAPVELSYPAATGVLPNRFRGDWVISKRDLRPSRQLRQWRQRHMRCRVLAVYQVRRRIT